MARGFALGVVTAIAAILVVGYLMVTSGALPAGQDTKPGRLERWASKKSLRATILREAQGLTSPIEPSDENLSAGVALYRAHCEVCHGGPDSAASAIARGLTPNAPQFAKHGVEDDPEGVTYWKVAHGIRFTGMPAYGDTLSGREMWQIALFAKHMDSLPPVIRESWSSGRAGP